MIAFFDCFSGVSGDMILGALVDAGLPLETLRSELGELGLGSYSLVAERVVHRGISGTRLTVQVYEQEREKHTGHQARLLDDVLQLIADSQLSSRVKQDSSRILRCLARAAASSPGKNVSSVRFIEAGAVDTLVDVVGACIGLEALGVSRVFASALPTGSGTVRCADGLLPVLAPGTLRLLEEAEAPTWPGPGPGELITPTGVAIVCSLATFSQPRLRLQQVGYGFGHLDTPWPNALRIWLGASPEADLQQDTVALLEANLDDAPGEILGAAMRKLLAAGALDVFFTPTQMQKNRPAIQLSVIAPRELAAELAQIVLEETPSLGLRVGEVRRWKAGRRQERIQTPWGEVTVKLKTLGEVVQVYPEYEDCLRLAQETGATLQQIYHYVGKAGLSGL